jgi:HSP20 family protein
MRDVIRTRSIRLGIVVAFALVALVFAVPSLSSGPADQNSGKAAEQPSAGTQAKEKPSAEAPEEQPQEQQGDFWINLKDKNGKDLEGSFEDQLRQMSARMEAFDRRMDEMMRQMGQMEHGMPGWQWSRRPWGGQNWGGPAEFERWLQQLEHEFGVGFGHEPFRFENRLSPDESLFSLRMDSTETDKAYIYTLDVPGLAKEDIKVELNNGMLTVNGERKQQVEEQHQGRETRREILYGRFERSIPLPQDADSAKVTSKYENGVLTITVPKKEQQPEQSKRIIVHHP